MAQKQFKWKEKYYTVAGNIDVDNYVNNLGTRLPANYVSIAGDDINGDGTRERPYRTKVFNTWYDRSANVISNSNHAFTGIHGYTAFVGQDVRESILDSVTYEHVQDYRDSTGIELRDCQIKKIVCTNPAQDRGVPIIGRRAYINNLQYDTILAKGYRDDFSYNCIFRGPFYIVARAGYSNSTINDAVLFYQCTYIDCEDNDRRLADGINNLYIDCNIRIFSTDHISKVAIYYKGFNNCKFLVGGEATFTELIGDTPEEMRQNLADRCHAQNIATPNLPGQSIPFEKWIFSRTSVAREFEVKFGSEIDKFCKDNGIYLGYNPNAHMELPITASTNTPNAFNNLPSNQNVNFAENSISLNEASTGRTTGFADSGIIYLGGMADLKEITVDHDLLSSMGVKLSDHYILGNSVTSGSIEKDVMYMVTSNDNNIATVTYNEEEYSTDVTLYKESFIGIDGVTSFTPSSNAVVRQVTDPIDYKILQIRLVDALPGSPITSGNLQSGYWYIVIPDDLGDVKGAITYKGTVYPPYSSFLTTDTSSFTISTPGVHLMRCWKQEYDATADANFWANRNKPKWFNVEKSDMRGFRKDNLVSSLELMTDSNGDYIATGNPDFYAQSLNAGGTNIPYALRGVFLQIRISLSNKNPILTIK